MGYLHLYCSLSTTLSCMTSALALFIEGSTFGYLHLHCSFIGSIYFLHDISTCIVHQGLHLLITTSALFTESLSPTHTHPADTFLIQILLAPVLFHHLHHNDLYILQSMPCTAPLHIVMQPILFLQSFLGSFGHLFACIFI